MNYRKTEFYREEMNDFQQVKIYLYFSSPVIGFSEIQNLVLQQARLEVIGRADIPPEKEDSTLILKGLVNLYLEKAFQHLRRPDAEDQWRRPFTLSLIEQPGSYLIEAILLIGTGLAHYNDIRDGLDRLLKDFNKLAIWLGNSISFTGGYTFMSSFPSYNNSSVANSHIFSTLNYLTTNLKLLQLVFVAQFIVLLAVFYLSFRHIDTLYAQMGTKSEADSTLTKKLRASERIGNSIDSMALKEKQNTIDLLKELLMNQQKSDKAKKQ
ncbi:hypothetical protein SAMN05216327_11263 [Dyadobacter sp. SG02]|uniref:hypothetical protein n=1 Tax=Dyadobacter sp. SG02 TaxID=1855291 RepID=UPI0008CCA385|nr:hypothetical protein [Dyadobacter sp. SG02]SEJ53264.1 hypothetical protein SAMN05216327_11263 [Dyadobacter sp. SG02]